MTNVHLVTCFAWRFKKTAFAIAVMAHISGCVSMPRSPVEPNIDKIQASAGHIEPTSLDSPVIEVDAGYEDSDMFLLRPLYATGSGKLPNKIIAPFDLNQSGIFDTLRILVAGTGLALKIEGGLQGSEAYGSATMFDVHGTLKEVIENLSESMGFFYSVQKNTLLIQPEQQFVVAFPPALADDNAASLTNTLQFLGAKDPYIDRMAGTLVFKANRTALAKIEPYLNTIRETRSMIVYQINIFQVDLRDNADLGIQWNRLGWAGPNASGVKPISTGTTTTSTAATTDGVNAATTTLSNAAEVGKSLQAGLSGAGLGVVLSTARFSIDSLVNFLKTQGTVSTLSQPRIAIMNNTVGSLSVGRTTTFVSRIGTTYSTSLNQVTTETRDLDTGVDLQLRGQTSDNTVITTLDMKIIDLLSLTPIVALGTNLTTPDVAKRKLNNIIRTSPGEMFVMGGITLTRDSRNDSRGLGNNGFSKDSSKSELVLALRTQIVRFLPKGEKAKRDAERRRMAEKLQADQAREKAEELLRVRSTNPGPIFLEDSPTVPLRLIPPTPRRRTNTPEPLPPKPQETLKLRMSALSQQRLASSKSASVVNTPLKLTAHLSAASIKQVAAIQKANEHYFPASLVAKYEALKAQDAQQALLASNASSVLATPGINDAGEERSFADHHIASLTSELDSPVSTTEWGDQ